MSRRIEFLMRQINNNGHILPDPNDLIAACRRGSTSQEFFEKYGAALTLQWVVGREEKAKLDQNDVNKENDLNDHELADAKTRQDLAAANARIKRIKDRIAAGLPLDDEDAAFADAPTLDPFPNEYLI